MNNNTLDSKIGNPVGHDICPIMSIGQNEPVSCTRNCGWFDTEEETCSMASISGALKHLKDIAGN